MRVDVPQFSLEVPEGWGTPLLAVVGAVGYGVGWAITAGLAHRRPVRQGRFPASPLDQVDTLIGAIWPALLVGEVLTAAGRLAWRVARVPLWPFVALARKVAGDTCPLA
jgi:hypothetical protein